MTNQIENNLKQLFCDTFSDEVSSIVALPISGSSRKYYRICGNDKTVIGAYNSDIKENETFFSFTKHFFSFGLKVPELYANSKEGNHYILQDLGDDTLFSLLMDDRSGSILSDNIIELYKSSLEGLIKIQVVAGRGVDFKKCYPRKYFDRQSMQWDLNYFKYYFLKLKNISFDEQKLENDFNTLISYLSEEKSDYFMFRDFQSRNIMVYNGMPYFIDYQGGRKGPLQYDLASLLFQAKAGLPPDLRVELLDFYLSKLSDVVVVDKDKFVKYYYGFVLIRMLQVLGAYGFRGLYERKPHFLESIDFAIENLKWFTGNIKLDVSMPEISNVLKEIIG